MVEFVKILFDTAQSSNVEYNVVLSLLGVDMMSVVSREPKKPAKQFPSRLNTRYVGIPKSYHDALQAFADLHSTPDEVKSISWAVRVAIRRLMDQENISLKPVSDDK